MTTAPGETPWNWDDIAPTVRVVRKGGITWLTATCPSCGTEIKRELGPVGGLGSGERLRRQRSFALQCTPQCGAAGKVTLEL